VFLLHKTPPGHPESPERVKAILDLMKRTKLPNYVEVRSPVPIDERELELVHDRDYVEYVKRVIEAGGGYLDPDTYASPTSWEPALYAAGTVAYAAQRAVEGDHWPPRPEVRRQGVLYIQQRRLGRRGLEEEGDEGRRRGHRRPLGRRDGLHILQHRRGPLRQHTPRP